MLQCLYPLQQMIARHFFVSLMDDNNLTIQAHVVNALFIFFLQIRDSVQALLHQHC